MRFQALLKDPLVHFLAAGAVLFAAASALAPPEADETIITVDRSALLTHIQFRSKAFEPEAAARLLDSLDADAREKLIADFVREEALDREAAALGVDANDYVIRQRRVQKVEFLAEASAQPGEPEAGDIQAYYATNADRYRSPPSATFTHVFVSAKERPRDDAKAMAKALLQRLIAERAAFDDAPRYGERFLFHKNYVDRTDDYIKSQLGEAATVAIFDAQTLVNGWTGPFSSDHGEHLLYVTARAPARHAPLEEIADLVRSDLIEERRQRAIDAAIGSIVARYRVIRDLEVGR